MTRSNTSQVKLTRRSLLAGAAAAMAAPMVVRTSARGAAAPSNRIHMAAIGVGGRGSGNNWGAFAQFGDVRYLAACDVRQSRREAFAARLNTKYGSEVCKPYADFREVLALKDVDGVVVSTPDHWHVPIACAAAVAKKDMYVEKPLGTAMAWAWKLRDLVKENGVIFQYGTQQRSGGGFRRAVHLVRNGYIGEVRRIEAWCPDMSSQFGSAHVKPYGSTEPADVPADLDYDAWLGPAPKKPYTVDRCTCFGAYHIYDYALGFIAGWGAHPLDIAQWGLDTDGTGPITYEGTGTIPPEGSLWNSIESWDVTCTYAGGIPIRFMGHRVAKPVVETMANRPWRDHGTTFFGSEGWVSVDRGGCYMNVGGKTVNAYTLELKASDTPPYESPGQGRNLLDCMKSRTPTINPLESAIRSDTISHLSDICIRLRRTIRWDPKAEKIVGDAEATRMLDRPMRAPWTIEALTA
jgi:hypothetical protein